MDAKINETVAKLTPLQQITDTKASCGHWLSKGVSSYSENKRRYIFEEWKLNTSIYFASIFSLLCIPFYIIVLEILFPLHNPVLLYNLGLYYNRI